MREQGQSAPFRVQDMCLIRRVAVQIFKDLAGGLRSSWMVALVISNPAGMDLEKSRFRGGQGKPERNLVSL